MMVKYGKRDAISFNATFGTSDTQYPLYTIMVFDKWRNGIPVAFFVISSSKEKDLERVMTALIARIKGVKDDWKPAAIIVDNAQAELNALGSVWPKAKLMLCFWHVQKSWSENVVRKIKRIDD